MFDSILVVCTGNICRSPTAERILAKNLPAKKIRSVGLRALVDQPADATAADVAIRHEVSLAGHKGTQYCSAMAGEYDLILVMETNQLEKICASSPQVRGKIMLLGHWLGQREIPDPYRKSREAFESVYQLIDQACKHWAERLAG